MKTNAFARHFGIAVLAICATFIQASMVNSAHATETASAPQHCIGDAVDNAVAKLKDSALVRWLVA